MRPEYAPVLVRVLHRLVGTLLGVLVVVAVAAVAPGAVGIAVCAAPALGLAVLGCAIALIIGVLLWPGRGLPDHRETYQATVAAVARHIEFELADPSRGPLDTSSTAARAESYSSSGWSTSWPRPATDPRRAILVALRRCPDLSVESEREPADPEEALAIVTRLTTAIAHVGGGRAAPGPR